MADVKGRNPRGRVATSDVIAAAITIVDEGGVEALTIRGLADACGLSPMGIYRHVRDKDELLDRIVEQANAGVVDRLTLSGEWRADVLYLFRSSRRFFLDHPGVTALSMARPTPVTAVARFYDLVLEALASGGITGPDAVRAFDALLMFSFGSVLWEIPRGETARRALVEAARRDGRAGRLVDQADDVGRRDATEYFEFGLELIVSGLELRAGT
jgi:AcrR family transcriptional regulator